MATHTTVDPHADVLRRVQPHQDNNEAILIERGRKLPFLRCVYATVVYACCAIHQIKSSVIGIIDGVAHSGGNLFYNTLVNPLSTLLSGSSRLPSSDGRANHRTHTLKRLARQQLDSFLSRDKGHR